MAKAPQTFGQELRDLLEELRPYGLSCYLAALRARV